eukprot:CAMPEP_0170497764 /NCGR_PEP_ID=MMETSP0208-20121228/25761_1 /TAXON_ID=197538 /ORGANISM="Strombidium inclinatum, Strain S3" /LENGTH=63 /DNA_ID=CAMNT_0010774693 /DNA_START=191 /DNA_END=382 /DNA_ORIENTATION=+
MDQISRERTFATTRSLFPSRPHDPTDPETSSSVEDDTGITNNSKLLRGLDVSKHFKGSSNSHY